MKKIAIVSGSSRGIGKAIAKQLLEFGDRVYINGRTAADVEKTVKELGSEARPWVADLTNESIVKEGLARIAKQEGRIDHVIANVGSGKANPGVNLEPSEFREVFETNFFQTVHLCQHVLPYLKEGHIVFISSIAGVESIGAPMPYNAAKAALLSYMKSLSDRVAADKIQVNAISPGNVIFAGGRWEEKLNENREAVEKMIHDKVPMRKFVRPEDVARGVRFLLESPMITGHNLIIDGGQVRKYI